MKKLLMLLVMLSVLSCGKDGNNGVNGVNGAAGLDGSDGSNYYSYLVRVNLQEIVGDDVREEFETSEGDVYQLPKKFDVTVDNPHSGCKLQDLTINFETDDEIIQFTFQPTQNRYKMKYKSGPLEKFLDTSTLRVYYESEPEVDCGDAIYRLHSGLQFSIRVIQRLEF